MVPYLNIKGLVTEKCESKNVTGSEKLLEPICQAKLGPSKVYKKYIAFFVPGVCLEISRRYTGGCVCREKGLKTFLVQEGSLRGFPCGKQGHSALEVL